MDVKRAASTVAGLLVWVASLVVCGWSVLHVGVTP